MNQPSQDVDKVEQIIFEKENMRITPEIRDVLYWLFDNDIEFEYNVSDEYGLTIDVVDDTDYMALKLRWEE